MFERFTDQARRVVVLAQEEARLLDHDYIGTEHILLGLIHEEHGAGSGALESVGVTLEPTRQQVEQILGRGKKPPSGHIPFTPQAKKTLELALREALQLGDNYIGPEHILLGLLREGDGAAVQVIVRQGVDLNRIRQQVIRLHRAEGAAGARVRFAREAEDIELLRRGAPLDVWIRESLEKIMDRLAAIERHLGMQPDTSEQPGKAEAAEPGAPAAGEPGSGKPADEPGGPEAQGAGE